MKNILILTQLYPSGLTGTTVKTRATIEYLLERGFGVDVVCVHHKTMVKNGFVAKNLKLVVVEKRVISRVSMRDLLGAGFKLFSVMPFRVKKLYDGKVEEQLRQWQKEKDYEYVFFDGFSTLQYAKSFGRKYVYIDDEDISDLLCKRVMTERNPLVRAFFAVEWVKCLVYERKYLARMGQLWAISPKTHDRLRKLTKAKSRVMPTVVAKGNNVFRKGAVNVVFTGLLSWMENVNGLSWFVDNCWKEIIAECPKSKLVVVGQMARESLVRKLKRVPGIEFKGYVENLEDVYKDCGVAVSPVFINAGIKVKVLTYLSYGLPVVSTPEATWGMPSEKGVVKATKNDFAGKVIDLLRDADKRSRLSKAGIDNIAKNHSKKALASFFEEVEVIS